jgi:signal transduction histidine kinase/ligand-binding sensor domain-containing protein/CheY-like chemotaxis protein
LHIDADGRIWVTCGNTLCALGTEALEIVGRAAGLPDSDWRSIQRDAKGNLWVRDSTQLWFRRSGEASFQRWSGEMFPSSIAGLYLDARGELVIPGQGGIRFLSGWPRDQLGVKDGIPGDHVANVLWDREQNIWLGLPNDGLARLRGKGRWVSWTTAEGLSSNAIVAINRDQAGQLWVGTRFGLNLQKPGDTGWVSLTSKDGLPNDEIRSIAADGAGGLWVGSGVGGLARVDAKTRAIRVFGTKDGILNDQIVTIDKDNDDRIWIMTRKGVYRTSARGPWKFEKMEFPFVERRFVIYRVKQFRDGSLWAVGRSGLMQWKGTSWQLYGPEIGIRDRSLVFLTEGADGSPWIGYGGFLGVARVDLSDSHPRLEHFTYPEHLDSNDICFLERDSGGHIWVGCEKGVSVYDGRSWKRYHVEDGLVWDDTTLNAFWADADGTVFIGTNRGLSAFDPPEPFSDQVHPSVVINSFKVGGRETYPLPSAIPWKDRWVEVSLALLSFSNDRDVRFRFRLRGAADDWMESEHGDARFQNLEAGSYTFEATSSLRGAPWNPVLTRHEFRVLPPWWATWWLRLLVALAFVAIVLWAWKLRLRVMMQKHRHLEQVVAERTASVVEANERMRREIEERERAIREKEALEEQLLQSHKMEAVGRLAGGIAHDFNNLLTVINGYGDLALAQVEARGSLHSQITQIRKAGDRAAQLTQQLLAFSRRQVLQPQVVDPNAVIRDTGYMLHRLLGENIEISLKLDPAAGQIKVDPGQLQQVLINLSVNARDAMPDGGRLIIQTANVELDGHFPDIAESVVPGPYVCLAIIDSGTGLDTETRAHLFEPFFTTKEVGKGTGLGLSTVFGIVKQSGGQILVESDVGRGSTFKLFFPRSAEENSAAGTSAVHEVVEGSETILAVEDQAEVRTIVRESLARHGYAVLEAPSGERALGLLQDHPGPIHLLLTDVVMPGMNGQTLANKVEKLRPGTKVLFISGYAGGGIVEEGFSPDSHTSYLQKPFTPSALVAKVREILEKT